MESLRRYKVLLWTLGSVFFGGLAVAAGVYYYFARGLPSKLDLASEYQPSVVSTVYDAHGEPIGEFYLQRRIVVPLERISPYVVQAFLAAEDARFFKHGGIDFFAIFRALLSNLMSGEVREGGSTLTQQLVRNFFLTPERTYGRKIREAILAFRVERNHTKEEILYLYLNQVYFGHGNYGIEAASRDYFGKGADQLTLGEAALLAGLPRAPSRSSPYRDYFSAMQRQHYVLWRMYKEGFISKATYEETVDAPIRLSPAPSLNSQIAPHFVEHVRQHVGAQYGFDPLLRGGLRIYTSLDASLQRAAQQAVREGLDEVRLRVNKKVAPEDRAKGEVEGALVAMDPRTGLIRAMVGGYDFAQSQFNRATQAKRQPGSAFKPIVYSAAIEKGLTEVTVMEDGPLSFRMAGGKLWQPQNYGNRFFGPVTLRSALAHSLNSVAVRLVTRLGLDRVMEQARKMGIESPLEKNLSMALGSSSVSVLEMVRAYAVFANGGGRVEPIFVTKVTDRNGKILEEKEPEVERVLSPEVAYVLTDMLKNVVQSGTARSAAKLGRHLAGKTGTTSDFRDGWFVGYTPELIAGVWVGYDDHRSLGNKETGGRTALPIWVRFMTEAGQGGKKDDFPVPKKITWKEIHLGDGYPLPVFESSRVVKIPFVTGSVPAAPFYGKKAERAEKESEPLDVGKDRESELFPPPES